MRGLVLLHPPVLDLLEGRAVNDSRHVALVKRAIAHGKIAQATALQNGGDRAAGVAAYDDALEGHMPPPAQGWHPTVECGRWGCPCTHTAPCDRGWVDLQPRVNHAHPYQRVAPCPVCRPAAATRYEADLRASSTRSS